MHKGEKAVNLDDNVLNKVRVQDFQHRLVNGAVKTGKMKTVKKVRQTVMCNGEDLENVFFFKYLDTLCASDGHISRGKFGRGDT